MFVVAARGESGGMLWGKPTAIAIRVVNINEGPEFSGVETSGTYDGHIVRYVGFNTPAGQDIGDPIVAVDPEGQTVTFTKDGGDTGNNFVIDSSTGQIRTNNLVNVAVGTSIAVSIRATDASNVQVSQSIRIVVVEQNNAPTVSTGQSFTVAEHTDAGEEFGTAIVASDPDTEQRLRFSVTAVSPSDPGTGLFTINPDTGVLQIRADANPLLLNFETGPISYQLTVRATDNDPAAKLSDEATVSVTVTNINERPRCVFHSTQDVAARLQQEWI